jgi:hypothetical protein
MTAPAATLAAEDLAVFAPIARHYFETVGGETPSFGEPSIELGEPRLAEFSGFIPVAGPVNGWVALTFGADLADELLTALNEPRRDGETRRDLAGEVASTIASNAREHFGKRLSVEPARATSEAVIPQDLEASPLIFLIPFTWRSRDAALLISLHP